MPTIPIRMPQLGESIAEAIVVAINIKKGDTVEADQEIMEVETNKAVMGVTTPCRGTIVDIIVEVDQSYVVGATLAHLEVSVEDAEQYGSAGDDTSAPAADTGDAVISSGNGGDVPHFGRPSSSTEFETSTAEEPGKVQPTIQGLPVPANATGASYLSPRMKARMQELGLHAADLAGIAGSGAGGRVTIEDFEKFIASIENEKMIIASPMRIAVADSMRRSWTRPLATVGMPCRLDSLLTHRRNSDPKPGPALYAIRALAVALAENTAAAGRLIGERIVLPKTIDIGFAVEVADGVLVPCIRDADQKPLRDLVQEYNSLVQQARDRRLPSDARGPGIATVTNYGTFNIVWATPIPLPEQNVVLGIGRGIKWPLWDEEKEQFVPGTEAVLTLSFDHRIIDGGAAGRLLSHVCELLQVPDAL
jgi:pyruvate/2-oxoglutarate dehydrogenase complex dihydrolipoamide acyltransferase (E2) component